MGRTAINTGGWRWGRWWPGVLPVALLRVGCDALDFLNQPGGLAIQRFTATPAEIMAGGSTALNWDVEGAESVQIEGIGTVPPKGSRQVSPAWSTTYVLTARAGTSSAAATLQVVVQPGPSPSPSPSGSPSPSPSPSVTPTPTSSPSPSPSSSPTPSTSPSATPVAVSCGQPAATAGNCALTIGKPDPLPVGQCVELTSLAVSPSCPVGFSTVRALRFAVTARTSRALLWRRAPNNGDVLEPASGSIGNSGRTEVVLTDIVLDDRVRVEIVDGADVVLRFTLRHY
jgi:hypothetical protein